MSDQDRRRTPRESRPFNQLTPAEAERLDWLTEELGEAIQAIGKIKRHGYASDNQGKLPRDNRAQLQCELGHVAAAVALLVEHTDLNEELIDNSRDEKILTVQPYLHHHPITGERSGARV